VLLLLLLVDIHCVHFGAARTERKKKESLPIGWPSYLIKSWTFTAIIHGESEKSENKIAKQKLNEMKSDCRSKVEQEQ